MPQARAVALNGTAIHDGSVVSEVDMPEEQKDYLKTDNSGPNMGRGYKDIIEISTMKPLTKDR